MVKVKYLLSKYVIFRTEDELLSQLGEDTYGRWEGPGVYEVYQSETGDVDDYVLTTTFYKLDSRSLKNIVNSLNTDINILTEFAKELGVI